VSRRSDLPLAWLWLKARLRLMARTPRATFFTFVFPLILLALLDSLYDSRVSVPGGKVDFAQRIADLFPLIHLVRAFNACFSPYTTGSGFSWHDLASLAAWCAIGTVVAVRRFATEATDEEGGSSGLRRWRRATAAHAGS
jgi:hypothetical protein